MKVLTNGQIVDYLGLPQSIMEDLANQQGSEFQATKNQFLEALINKICYQTVEEFGWENPLKRFDSYPINYGDTIENVFVETPKGYVYDKNATNPFGVSINSVKVLYASINYEMQYKVTIYDALLRRAALNEYGFMNLVDAILRSMTTAKNVDEYFATLRMLNNPEIFGNSTGAKGSKAFGVVAVNSTDTAKVRAEKITAQIVDDYTAMELPKDTMNAMGVLTASDKSRLVLIVRRDILNSINLDYLTGVFNLSKVELLSRIIQVDSFVTKDQEGNEYGEELAYMIVDERGFDNHVALQDGGLIYNPQGKYTNHFLNLWKIISYKYFYNAIARKLVEADAPQLVIKPYSGEVLGKMGSSLQEDLVVGTDSISGKLKYTTGYTGYSGDPELQVGNFISLIAECDKDDAVITVELVGGTVGPVTLDSDMISVGRVTSSVQKIRFVATSSGVSTVKEFSLEHLVLEEA